MHMKARKGFYRQLFTLLTPIVVQNLITSSVSLADVVMLGRVDQTVLSASSLAGQVQFLLNIVFFGLASALTILSSQYWGKGDRLSVSRIFGIGLLISLGVSLLAAGMALFNPRTLISIWTNDEALAEAGATYLRYVGLSYLFAGIAEPYLSIMKSCERVRLSMVVSLVTLLTNVCLNAVFIFGLLGMPRMGILGAALATTIARLLELVLCILDFLKQKIVLRSFRAIFGIPKALAVDFMRYSMPALANDALWGLAYNMNSVIMGHLGSDIVAASAVVSVSRDMVTTVGYGLAAAASIMLGKEIGLQREEQAREDAASIFRVTVIAGILEALVLLCLIPIIPRMVKISETAGSYLRFMLLLSMAYQMGQIINTLLIASFFRCGGDSRYGLRMDLLCMWCVAVPLSLISAFVLHWPPLAVYAVMCLDEFIKMPFAIHHYLKGNWIHNLTREFR